MDYCVGEEKTCFCGFHIEVQHCCAKIGRIFLFWGGEIQKFSRMEIQFGLHMEDVIVGERGEIVAAQYVLLDEFVGVFDQTFLPGQQLCNSATTRCSTVQIIICKSTGTLKDSIGDLYRAHAR